jgi:REP element-mobilizing transposase RayT
VVERSDTTGSPPQNKRIPQGCQLKPSAMPSTFLALHYHIIFSTKNRTPLIAPEWGARLHEYLGGSVKGLGGISQGVGGIADHVHLLVGLKATHRLSDFVRELKKASSAWVHEEISVFEFAWQEGYGAFSVSPPARTQVQKYIANQLCHHSVKTFRQELEGLLRKAGVRYEGWHLD